MNIYGTNLKTLRMAKNSSQEEVARAAGITKATISKYENGVMLPSLDVAQKIAIFFGVTIDSMTILNQDQDDIITEKNYKEYIGLPKDYFKAIKIALNNDIPPKELIEFIEFTIRLKK